MCVIISTAEGEQANKAVTLSLISTAQTITSLLCKLWVKM